LLDWDAPDLAKRVGVRRETILSIEKSLTKPRAETVEKIVQVFNAAGVEFIENEGVRFRSNDIEVFEGVDGFSRFHNVVFEYLKQNGGKVCVCGSSGRTFSRHRNDGETHRARMAALVKERNDIDFKILAEEGDTYLPNTAYAKYRWQPKEFFPPTAFYAFGDYLGLLSFESMNPPHIVLIRSKIIAESYRRSFAQAWKSSKEIPSAGPSA
jgi:DNA-binding XRE family transcriptional regulator